MAVAGNIAAEAKSHVFVTWDALLKDSRYGESSLQSKVDLVKQQLFGEVVDPDLEASLYDASVIEYAGKLVALKIIPGGAEYWAAQKIVDSSGTRVNATWVDRVDKLWKLYENLQKQVAEQAPDISEIIGTPVKTRRRRKPIGVTAGINDTYVTPNPDDFPREGAIPLRTGL